MFSRAAFRAWFLAGGITPRLLAERTWNRALENEIPLRAAAAAYYALAALVPFLTLIVALAAGLAPDITGEPSARGAFGRMTVEEFRLTLSHFLPQGAYEVVAAEIARIQRQPPVGLLSLTLALSLWLASGLFGTVIDALNRIQGVLETRSFWRLTLSALGLTMLEAVITLGALLTLVILPEVREWLGWSPQAGAWETAAEWLAVACGLLLTFAAISYLGPSLRRRWKWITPGSVLGTIALLASSLLLRLYIQHFGNYGKAYGSLAGVTLLSFWFWIAAVILLVAFQIDSILEDAQEKRT